MNARRMWHLIAEMVHTYAEEGDHEKAIETLAKAIDMEPQWIPNALFDERTRALRHHERFVEITTLPPHDAPAYFNASQVALEYRETQRAYEFLAEAFRLAERDGTVAFLVEALRAEEVFRPHIDASPVAALITKYSG